MPEWRIAEFEIDRPRSPWPSPGGAGGNMAARRSMFDAIGPWDEQIGPGARFRSCEEGDIVFPRSDQRAARRPGARPRR